MIDKEARDELADLEDILAGSRRGEYSITNEVTFAFGNWLIHHSQEVLALVDANLPVVAHGIAPDYADSAE